MDKYILDGETPVLCEDSDKWSTWMVNNNKVIAKFTTSEGVKISTVFLGVDHRTPGSHGPILFETMIFGGEHDQYCERYSNYNSALAGHMRASALVKNDE